MAELADAVDSKSTAPKGRASSSLAPGITVLLANLGEKDEALGRKGGPPSSTSTAMFQYEWPILVGEVRSRGWFV